MNCFLHHFCYVGNSTVASFKLAGWLRRHQAVILFKCFQCMPMMKYTTSRQPGSKSLQFFFACDPPASKALYSLMFTIKLQFGDCGPVCPGGATAHALKKDCATSCTCSVPFRNSELAKIKQLCRNILLYTLPTVSVLGPHLLITNI